MVNRPNLFSHARGELAQDAMLAWMATWASRQYQSVDEELHALGRRFLTALLNVAEQSTSFEQVEVQTQQRFVDVLIHLDGHDPERERWIVLEDKTETNEHNEQISRYQRQLMGEKNLPLDRVPSVMVHTGDVYDLHEKDYGVLTRGALLEVLKPYSGSNAIVQDFRDHLQRWHEEVAAFETLPFSQWGSRQWQGFFSALTSAVEPMVRNAWWGYVSNAQGGFWGMAWHFCPLQEQRGELYLQIEQTIDGARLAVRVMDSGAEDRGQLRQDAHDLLAETARAAGFSLTRPARFGRGRHMSIAVLTEEVRHSTTDEALALQDDWREHLRSTLRRAESLLDLAVRSPLPG